MMTSSLTVNTICWDYDYERDSEGNFCKKNIEILENHFVEFSYTRRWQSSETGEHTYVEWMTFPKYKSSSSVTYNLC